MTDIKKKIAILGAGFSGLATAIHLLRQSPQGQKPCITFFDPAGIGSGTSKIATGFLHKYPSLHAKKAWQSDIALKATKELLLLSEKALGKKVANSSGIFRPALDATQEKSYKICAEKESNEVVWWEKEKVQKEIPSALPYPGIFITSGITVYPQRYLEGLWKICQKNEASLQKKAISSLEELSAFDFIIVALGAHTNEIKELTHLPISITKGQLLEYQWPEEIPPLPFSMNSRAHIMMDASKKKCFVGATYERDFKDNSPEINSPLKQKKEEVEKFFPSLQDFSFISCKAGLRASVIAHNHIPLVGRIDKKSWIITGMGSKGLLYHSWLGKLLSLAILNDNEELLPKEVQKQLLPSK